MKNLINYFIISTILSFAFAFEIPDAIGYNGVVVCSKKEAAQIGIDILKKGGNAIDASVGVAFALAVTHPSAGNIGGGGFAMIRLANGDVTSFDFRETAPSLAYENMFLDSLNNVIPGKSKYTSWAAGVPGSVHGLGTIHEKFGSLPWDVLVYPSVNLARFGFELDLHNIIILNSERYKKLLANDIVSKKIFTKDVDYKIGDLLIQKDLSLTLERIAKYGYKEFYEGKTSDYIIECMNRTGGLISRNDLRNYKSVEREPITFSYRGYTIHSMPPPSSGGITLASILNQLENVDFSEFNFHSKLHLHYLVESERRSYADRAEFLGDTDFINVPIDSLISKEYAKKRFFTISPDKASNSSDIGFGEISINESEETTHFSIVDKFGNSVSLTTTINGWYGSGISVDNAGFILNNEMDDFSSKPGFPNMYGLIGNKANSIQPGKRMLSSMTPTIVEDLNNDLFLVLGSPGGSTIITTVAQIIVNIIDFNMSIQESIEAKRFHHQWLPDIIQIERNSIANEVIDDLISMGHSFKYRSSIGESNCIMVKGEFILGSSDSRRGAIAIGY